jgi:hypothetical protein
VKGRVSPRRTWAAALAVASAAFLGASVASAQEQPGTGINISTSGGTPLLVEGIETEKLPVSVASGSRVCAPGPRVYRSEGDRFIFQQWSTGATEDCIVVTRPGTYRAMYAHEVLLVVKSTAPGIQRSMWVTFGSPVQLQVPALVEDGEDTRFRFQSWSDGETPFDRTNTIAPVKPTTLEVKWAREHRLQVDAPEGAAVKGSGWYADATNLVLRAPETFPGSSDQERWKFTGWESTSFPAAVFQNAQSAISALTIQMPYTIRAAYQKQYLVQATSPVGTLKRDWINDGQEILLETLPIIDVVPEQERLVFRRWEGIDALVSTRISGKVDKPIVVTATYDRQVMLKVNAPHGVTGDGWHKAGSVVTVGVPGSVSQMLVMKSSFVTFNGYANGQSTVQVLVNEPTVLTALYRTEPDMLVVGLIFGIPIIGLLIYLELSKHWISSLAGRARAGLKPTRSHGSPLSEPQSNAPGAVQHRNGVHAPQPLSNPHR